MKLNQKKGQLSESIVTLPVLIIVFIIIAVSVLVTLGIKTSKQPTNPEITALNGLDYSILLEPIKIDNKQILIIDSLIKYKWKSSSPLDMQGFDYKFALALE